MNIATVQDGEFLRVTFDDGSIRNVPKDSRNGDYRTVLAWVAGGGSIQSDPARAPAAVRARALDQMEVLHLRVLALERELATGSPPAPRAALIQARIDGINAKLGELRAQL